MKKSIQKKVGIALVAFALFSNPIWAVEGSRGVVLQNSAAYLTTTDFIPACYVFEGNSFTIAEEKDSYYGLLLENNDLVYVAKKYVRPEVFNVGSNLKNTTNIIEVNDDIKDVMNSTGQVNKGEVIAGYAKQFIGIPYVYGGNSLVTGVDCSGFIQQLYLRFGLTLQRSSHMQYLKDGIAVQRDELQLGDLIFYGYNGIVSHVTMYIGNEEVIHSPAPGQTVCIAPVEQSAPIMGYKRVL